MSKFRAYQKRLRATTRLLRARAEGGLLAVETECHEEMLAAAPMACGVVLASSRPEDRG